MNIVRTITGSNVCQFHGHTIQRPIRDNIFLYEHNLKSVYCWVADIKHRDNTSLSAKIKIEWD